MQEFRHYAAVVLSAALIAGAISNALLDLDVPEASLVNSFIGVPPNAVGVEPLPPTF